MIALISRDAGGAEFISRYIKNKKKKFCIAASGPAVGVFKKNFRKNKNLSVEKAILMSDLYCALLVLQAIMKKEPCI